MRISASRPLHKRARDLIALILGILVSACASQSAVQGPVTQFAQGTTAAVAAEGAFLDQVDALHTAVLNAETRYSFIKSRQSLKPVDLETPSPEITPENRQGIDQLLQAILLYSKALEALANDGVTTSLDQNAKNLATSLQSFDSAVLQPLTQPNASTRTPVLSANTADVAAAGVRAIANFVLGRIITRDVKAAATQMAPQLGQIVNGLQEINNGWANVSSKRRTEFRQTSWLILQTRSVASSEYDPVVASYRQGAQAASATKANAALKAMLEANMAIATVAPKDVFAVVQDFVQQATAAYQFYKSLPQK